MTNDKGLWDVEKDCLYGKEFIVNESVSEQELELALEESVSHILTSLLINKKLNIVKADECPLDGFQKYHAEIFIFTREELRKLLKNARLYY